MKRIIYAFIIISISVASCNSKADKETVDKMAGEVCSAMSLIVDEDPMSMIDAHSALLKVQENTEEYGKVTEEQLLGAMKEKCPEGARKYMELVVDDENTEE
jgi:hypothetical protein